MLYVSMYYTEIGWTDSAGFHHVAATERPGGVGGKCSAYPTKVLKSGSFMNEIIMPDNGENKIVCSTMQTLAYF